MSKTKINSFIEFDDAFNNFPNTEDGKTFIEMANKLCEGTTIQKISLYLSFYKYVDIVETTKALTGLTSLSDKLIGNVFEDTTNFVNKHFSELFSQLSNEQISTLLSLFTTTSANK